MSKGYSPGAERRRGMAIASLILGILSIPTFGCLIVGGVAGVVLGIVALVRENRAPHVYGGKGLAIVGIAASALSLLVAIPLAGIAAAIAIPSLLRARVSANESATLDDFRALITAEWKYQSASGGYFGAPECLAAPATCLPAYSGPAFLDPALASATVKNGFRRTFHPGAPIATRPDGTPAPLNSLESYAYVAVPENIGQTGVRGFCGDSSGRLCSTDDGSAPGVVGGLCAPDCREMR